jgi:acyl-CoA dehydrogenase
MFGQVLSDFQLTQAKLAQMATGIDAAALLTYRAAWQRDQGRNVTKEAAMAKMTATEGGAAGDRRRVQMFGGLGVVSGSRSNGCTARSARCASTKARPKCSS